MSNAFTTKWLATALGVMALGGLEARAEPDTFGVGSGRSGPLAVTTANTVINAYAPVTAALARNATAISVGTCVGDPCFADGDLVLVYQATGLVPAPESGKEDPIDLTGSAAGRWELARLKSVSPAAAPTRLELAAPLVNAFAANVTQVIRVPEYTSVSIPAGRSLTASAWNGSTGGVVAFLAQNEVNNQGTITVDSQGFRGGQFSAGDGARGCSELDEPAPGGAQKGEGLGGPARYGAAFAGRGNVANGAGGAVCYRSGGGGGGNGGAGGHGGRSDGALDPGSTPGAGRDVGGLGGTALRIPALTHFTFGGGGGAGHGLSSVGPAGSGGGIVFFRANQLSGAGSITALGGAVGTFPEGGSGGGAGGSIHARIVRSAVCGAVYANGGIGGTSSSARVGPGGGGGGGQVLFQAAPGGACALLATGANAGTQQVPADGSYGAISGSINTPAEKKYGFIIPAPPTVATPAKNLITNNVRPRITGTARIYAEAAPNTEVIVFLDGVEIGRVMSDATGAYALDMPRDLDEREHRVEAAIVVDAAQSLNGSPNTFLVDITPPKTTISGPNGAIRERDPKFEFGASEDVVAYTCSLDGAAFTPCPADGVFPGLGDGAHSLQVRSEDRAGNVGQPTTQNFRVTVEDLALFGDGVGCSATGRDGSLLVLSLGALVLGLRRRGGSAR
ncbi:adventurous gliding motility protein AgmC [Archangium primigenium]|uniref:adventurous gliding motility protein AgmC n=1 Tax=[Archangium] primigenium TaxID=2792470 RepID=UPI00195A8546|nr:hypothetical protein [Archangium primigenium]MBM7113239.1 hypothetical protein [Archangium primigenium]